MLPSMNLQKVLTLFKPVQPRTSTMTSCPNSTELELSAYNQDAADSSLVKYPEPPSVPPQEKQNAHVHLHHSYLRRRSPAVTEKPLALIKYLYQHDNLRAFVPDKILIIPAQMDFQIKFDEYGDIRAHNSSLLTGSKYEQSSSRWTENHLLNGELNEVSMFSHPEGFVDPEHPSQGVPTKKLSGLNRSHVRVLQISAFLSSQDLQKAAILHSSRGKAANHPSTEVDDRDKCPFFLGLQFLKVPEAFFINPSKYAQEILKKYGLTHLNPFDTPMASAKPTEMHLTAIKRAFRYLKGTINRSVLSKNLRLELKAFAMLLADVMAHREDFWYSSFLDIDLVAGHQKAEKYCHLYYRILNTSPYQDAVLKSSDCVSHLQKTLIAFNKNRCIVTIKGAIALFWENQYFSQLLKVQRRTVAASIADKIDTTTATVQDRWHIILSGLANGVTVLALLLLVLIEEFKTKSISSPAAAPKT
ncbi:hypothetical protein Tco_1407268 [Tanacetum coccineum]